MRAFAFGSITFTELVTLATILPVLCLNAVGLRFYTRSRYRAGLGADDWLIVPGLAFFIGMCVCLLIGEFCHFSVEIRTYLSPAQAGACTDKSSKSNTRLSGATNGVMGAPNSPSTSTVSLLPSTPLLAKLQFAFQIQLILSFTFVKLSILSLYQRLFSARTSKATPTSSIFSLAIKASYGALALWCIAFLLLTVLSCGGDVPALFAGWALTAADQAQRCAVAWPAQQALASTDLLLDVWLLLLPQPLIWGLKLSAMKRAAISALIVLGMSCAAVSLARVVLFAQAGDPAQAAVPMGAQRVVTLNTWFAALDGGLAILAACAVTLRPLFMAFSFAGVLKSVGGSWSGVSSGGSRWSGGGSRWSKMGAGGSGAAAGAAGRSCEAGGKGASADVEMGGQRWERDELKLPIMHTPMPSPALRPGSDFGQLH